MVNPRDKAGNRKELDTQTCNGSLGNCLLLDDLRPFDLALTLPSMTLAEGAGVRTLLLLCLCHGGHSPHVPPGGSAHVSDCKMGHCSLCCGPSVVAECCCCRHWHVPPALRQKFSFTLYHHDGTEHLLCIWLSEFSYAITCVDYKQKYIHYCYKHNQYHLVSSVI